MLKKRVFRRVTVVAATILGLTAILYLGGLLSQFTENGKNGLEQHGLGSQAETHKIDFSPLFCLPRSLGSEGLKSSGIVILVASGIALYAKLHDRFNKGDKDERNFKRSHEGTYGTASWMSDKHMKKVLEVTTPDAAMGTILGLKSGKVICLPHDTRLNKHLFVCGSTGSGKSRAIVRNLLFQSIKRGESVVLTDSKAELYDDSAELFRRHGYQVKVFNLINPEHSDSWNCMNSLMGDTLTTQILTDGIISNTTKGKTDHFWDNGEGNLLKSLILYIDQDPSRRPGEKHLPAVYQFLTQNSEKQISALFDRLPVTHPAKAPYNLFSQASDTVRAGIVLGLGTRLQIMQNEAIRRITSSSDIDLANPGKAKCAYFVILSDQESTTEFLSSLFFSFLFIQLTRYADATPKKRCEVPVNIIFEEFNNVGRLDSYPRRLSVARSRALQICHIVQSLAQFQNRYPDSEWAEIIGSCDSQVMLGVTEQESAEFFSMRSGDSTVMVNSTMTTKRTLALAQVIPQYRESNGLGKRRLLTPDEILRFPNDELLIVIRGENVLRAKKFDYTGHPFANNLVSSSIFDYYPEGATSKALHTDLDGRTEPQIGHGRSAAFHTQNKTGTESEYESKPRTIAYTDTENCEEPETTKEAPTPSVAVAKPVSGKLFADSKPPEEF
ncbi:MAG: type IV secretory system conjugative DNA transfer family protein [Clostridiales bacterium]|nr:type IV secretory system conjugative DNA transfer family protein [Clostridiales bacterium]